MSTGTTLHTHATPYRQAFALLVKTLHPLPPFTFTVLTSIRLFLTYGFCVVLNGGNVGVCWAASTCAHGRPVPVRVYNIKRPWSITQSRKERPLLHPNARAVPALRNPLQAQIVDQLAVVVLGHCEKEFEDVLGDDVSALDLGLYKIGKTYLTKKIAQASTELIRGSLRVARLDLNKTGS